MMALGSNANRMLTCNYDALLLAHIGEACQVSLLNIVRAKQTDAVS